MLQAENLTLSYQDSDKTINAVQDVSIVIQGHRFIGILGPSGSGKSSLLYLLSGLRQPNQGEIYLDERVTLRVWLCFPATLLDQLPHIF